MDAYGIIKVLLVIACIGVGYYLSSLIITLRNQDYFKDKLENLNAKYEARMNTRNLKRDYGADDITKTSLLEKIDNLTEKSGVREKHPWLTGELLVVLIAFLVIVVMYVTFVLSRSFLPALGLGLVSAVFIISALKLKSRVAYDLIEDQLLPVVEMMKNFSENSSEIVNIVAYVIPYVNQPLKGLLTSFVHNAGTFGVGVQKSFDVLIDQVESDRFKQLFKNLKICEATSGRYTVLLKNFSGIAEQHAESRSKRKAKVKNTRLNILTVILGGFIAFYSCTLISSDILVTARTQPLGKSILFYLVCVVLFAIYKTIDLDKVKD